MEQAVPNTVMDCEVRHMLCAIMCASHRRNPACILRSHAHARCLLHPCTRSGPFLCKDRALHPDLALHMQPTQELHMPETIQG